MPVQRFAPMSKDFATFDCDAHVTEPPLIWERAKDFLTRDELDALKRTIWWDADGRLLIVNGRAGWDSARRARAAFPARCASSPMLARGSSTTFSARSTSAT
jgi:hypothetical protein